MPLPDAWRPGDSPATTASPDHNSKLLTDWVGRRWPLFKLAIWTSLLTILTLGIYRFWMKTRLRRYYWSSIKPGGVPLEYTGDPWEKLLGFLIAVTFLAFYIGIVNLILMFGSFAFFNGNVTGYVISFIGIIPFYFYAQYRARRYILARTRWRGIRFGLEPGAWGYAWRAMVHFLVSLLTLGILWPRMTFWLEKYRTDRTFFGNQRFHQGGRWQMLFPKIRHMAVGVVIIAIGAAAATSNEVITVVLIPLGAIWFAIGWVFYRVHTFRLLSAHKTAGGVTFAAEPRTGRVVGIYALGSVLIGLVFTVVLLGIGIAIGFLIMRSGGGADWIETLENIDGSATASNLAVIALIYFSMMLLWGAMAHALITFPWLKHYADTFMVHSAQYLPGISQRGRDEFAEAEGFAEALDVGAAL